MTPVLELVLSPPVVVPGAPVEGSVVVAAPVESVVVVVVAPVVGSVVVVASDVTPPVVGTFVVEPVVASVLELPEDVPLAVPPPGASPPHATSTSAAVHRINPSLWSIMDR